MLHQEPPLHILTFTARVFLRFVATSCSHRMDPTGNGLLALLTLRRGLFLTSLFIYFSITRYRLGLLGEDRGAEREMLAGCSLATAIADKACACPALNHTCVRKFLEPPGVQHNLLQGLRPGSKDQQLLQLCS